ncbi:MAG: porin family protein [Bacteroidota bacterium]
MVIKRVIFLLLILLSLNITAQHKPFQFGFKAGANIGWFNTSADDYNNDGANFGGSWGFIADIYIMQNYSFTTGFDVLYLNGTMSYPAIYEDESTSVKTSGNLKRNYRTKYIKLPFIFTMKTNQIKKLRYYGQIGFGLSILLTAEANDEFTPDNGGDIIEDTPNIYDELRATRESLILGAGVEIPIQGSTYMRVGLVYDNAFINVLKGNSAVDPTVRNNGRNSFVQLDVSILF